MNKIVLVRARDTLTQTDALSIVCALCIFCVTAAYGQATDTSYAYRFENGIAGWMNSPHGTIAKFSIESRPEYSRSGKSLKIDYCLGTAKGCPQQEDSYYSSWMSFQNFDVNKRYNTVILWVKRDSRDPADRELNWGFYISGAGVYSTAVFPMPVSDTAGRFLTFPMVSMHPTFYIVDKTKPMPAGNSQENCLSIGTHDRDTVKGVQTARVSGMGTLWVDDIGIYYDPKNPPFPGPYVPPVGIGQGNRPLLRPMVSRECTRIVVQPTGAALESGTRLFSLTGRRVLTIAGVSDAVGGISPVGE